MNEFNLNEHIRDMNIQTLEHQLQKMQGHLDRVNPDMPKKQRNELIRLVESHARMARESIELIEQDHKLDPPQAEVMRQVKDAIERKNAKSLEKVLRNTCLMKRPAGKHVSPLRHRK